MKRMGPDSLSSWIIAVGSCFINMMMFGMARLSGVLFVASVPRFHVTREQASFPYTLSQAIRNTSGPLVGYLGHKFGVRLVTSFGCVIAAAGIGGCFLAENITVITVLWGVIFGLGFGLGNILLPISINQYFDKKRATASGISFSGACIGSFALPPIVELLINTYGLSGTFLILAGFVLNCLPAALLLRKPNFTIKPSKRNSEQNSEKQSITQGSKVKLYTVENASQISDISTEKSFFKFESTVKEPPIRGTFDGSNGIQTYEERAGRHSHQTVLANYSTRKGHSNLSNLEAMIGSREIKTREDRVAAECEVNSAAENTVEKTDILGITPFTIPRKFSAGFTKPLIKEDTGDRFCKSYDELYSNLAYQAETEEPFQACQKGLYEASPSFTASTSVSSEKMEAKSVFESFSVIFDPIFILIAVTNAVYSAMFVCMITVIVDFARDIDVGETNEKYIIMSLSVGDLIGRLGLGWVTDDGYMTRSNFAAFCFFCQGVTTTVMAWSTGFTMLMAMAALYGLSEAGLILIFPLIVAEFIVEEKQTVAIPTSYFLSGPLCLTVAPLIGFFRDDIGSYEFIFYGMGVISLICTFCWLLAPCIARCRRNR